MISAILRWSTGLGKGGILGRYLSTVLRITSWSALLNVGLMIASGLTEGIGILLLIPLLQLVGLQVDEGAPARYADLVSGVFAALGVAPTLLSVLGAYVLVVAAQALLQAWQSRANVALDHRVVHELRSRLFRAVVHARWVLLSRSRMSDLTHALTSELGRVGAATYQFLLLLTQFVIAGVYLFLALQLSASMTGLALASGIALLLGLKRGANLSRTAGEQLSSASSGLFAAATEYLASVKITKSYGAEERHIARFAELSDGVGQSYKQTVRIHSTVRAAFSIGSVLVLSLILYLSTRAFQLSAAEILLLIFLFSRIVPKFGTIQQSFQQVVHGLPAFAGVLETIERFEGAAEHRAVNSEPVQLQKEVRMEEVWFSYEQGHAPSVLCNVNLEIPARQTTALVGPSGAGKSTIADLVMGLVEPARGRVCADGTPISAGLQAWRDRIGYVPQDTLLFHDTVRANLLWAEPCASDAELWDALRLAAADEFVARLPEGLETVLGDRGVRLSGGERQRLALARALLRKPSLLILDEATSALDSENERRIQQAIEALHGDITILIITHRLSAIRGADIIHVLENGRVVESGSWDALTADHGGRFHALWSEQAAHVSRSPAEQRPVVIS